MEAENDGSNLYLILHQQLCVYTYVVPLGATVGPKTVTPASGAECTLSTTARRENARIIVIFCSQNMKGKKYCKKLFASVANRRRTEPVLNDG